MLRAGHYVLLIAMGCCLFLPNLGGPSLWDLDESRNSECSKEMKEARNWLVPTFNGELRVDKPALLYWLQITAYHLFGTNEFSARLPSALAALATLLLCYELARSMFSPSTGLLAGIVVAATPMLCGAARFANPDALLNLFVVLTLACFWFGQESPRWWHFVAVGAAMGLGMLAKGPVAVVLPGGMIVLYLLWERRLGLLFDWRQALGMLTFVVIAVPWYLWVSLETKGEFAVGFFGTHNLGRALAPMENHNGGIWYYPLVLLIGMFPWSVFLPGALWVALWSTVHPESWLRWHAWWSAAAESDGSSVARLIAPKPPATPMLAGSPTADPYRLLLCWIGVWLLCFTVSATKLPNYVLPVIVPAAILLARFLDRWRTGQMRVPTWALRLGLGGLAGAGIVLSTALLVAGGALPFDVMRGQSIEELQAWSLLGLAPALGGLAGAWCLRSGRRTALIASVAMSGVLLLAPLAALGVTVVEGRKPARALVAESGADKRDQDIRIVVWQLDHLPSLNFYVGRSVHNCRQPSDVVAYLDYPLPVFVFLPAAEWQRLRPQLEADFHEVGRRRDIYKRDDVVLLTNR
jgi:4-amino-4-deoxy-L-arabinose transferase-like glycosyltransferase